MIVLVTGATAGFGAAMARVFVKNGHKVIAAGRRVERLEALAGELGPNLLPVKLDVTDKSAIQSALAALPADRIYELWLIGPDGDPVDVGTVAAADGLTLVELERELGPATTFAVTIEAERVSAPTSQPVLVASLEG